ncbi:MAG TPA: prenyltransferase/squalene oxidase repeat-containing protein [Planctomycetota bacterium]|nr:prenyltransferase/squalene oxidase repeat-containing protein [Planctomycetota bacterium]
MAADPAHQKCLDRALKALMSRRDPRGFWEGRLSSSPLATAVALCAFAGEDFPDEKRAAAFQYLAKTQNADGGWGDTDISKSNLAATLLVLSAGNWSAGFQPARDKEGGRAGWKPALQRDTLPPDALARANAFVEKLGGLREGLTRVYGKDMTFQVPIRMTAACAGLLKWSDVNALPFELALAPRGLMGALRLPVVSYALPALVCVGLARHANAPSWFLPSRWLRSAATNKALATILKMQPESGGYLEAIPITAFCLLGLKAAGRGDHPVAQNARKFLRAAQREDGSWPVEVNLSVWNTTRAIDALAAGGLLEKAMTQAERNATRDWILAQQTKTKSVYSDAAPGGWGWNHLSGSVPDADDTSGAILALRALGMPLVCDPIDKGRLWLASVQNENGGFPTFCRGWESLPFDKSAPDLTSHALRAIAIDKVVHGAHVKTGPAFFKSLRAGSAGMNFLRASIQKDGSYKPLWFGCESASDNLNATYGTAHALFAMENYFALLRSSSEGRPPPKNQVADHPNTAYRIASFDSNKPLPPPFLSHERTVAFQFLLSIQNPDGGFGGCKGAPSTAEETGLALRAIAGSGVDNADPVCTRAANWLMEHQRADGSWNPAPIGFYFAVLWYYEELYPLVYAVGGLGSWLKQK